MNLGLVVVDLEKKATSPTKHKYNSNKAEVVSLKSHCNLFISINGQIIEGIEQFSHLGNVVSLVRTRLYLKSYQCSIRFSWFV